MLRDEIVGLDELVPVLDGRWLPYVNLDNAATTPPLRAVVDAVERFAADGGQRPPWQRLQVAG